MNAEVAELLERDDWLPDVGPFMTLGQTFRIRTTDRPLAELCTALYAAMAAPAADDDGAVYRVVPPVDGDKGFVLRDEELIGHAVSPSRAFGLLQWAINRQVIAAVSPEVALLHAGGVVRDGLAVVLPAKMESGKTTLTAGLLGRGFGYLSDEAVAIHADGTATGYAKPLSIDRGSWQVLAHLEPELPEEQFAYLRKQWQVPADAISHAADRGQVAAIVLPTYEPDADLVCEPLGGAAGLEAVLRCTFGPEGSTVPSDHLGVLAALVSNVPVYRLVSGDLDAACDTVEQVLAEVRAAAS